jgi:Chaperone of endosialidase
MYDGLNIVQGMLTANGGVVSKNGLTVESGGVNIFSDTTFKGSTLMYNGLNIVQGTLTANEGAIIKNGITLQSGSISASNSVDIMSPFNVNNDATFNKSTVMNNGLNVASGILTAGNSAVVKGGLSITESQSTSNPIANFVLANTDGTEQAVSNISIDRSTQNFTFKHSAPNIVFIPGTGSGNESITQQISYDAAYFYKPIKIQNGGYLTITDPSGWPIQIISQNDINLRMKSKDCEGLICFTTAGNLYINNTADRTVAIIINTQTIQEITSSLCTFNVPITTSRGNFGTGGYITVAGDTSNCAYIDFNIGTLTPRIISYSATSQLYFNSALQYNFDRDIYTTGSIYATHYNLTSDERVKTNIKDIDEEMAINMIMELKPRTYNMTLESVDEDCYGFIAQEVEEIIPNSVNKIFHSFKDMNICIDSKDIDENNNIVTLRSDEIKVNEADILEIKYIDEKTGKFCMFPIQVTVFNVNDNVFSFYCKEYMKGTQLYIIGKCVNDFRTLRYTTIIPLLVKTVQSLLKQVCGKK